MQKGVYSGSCETHVSSLLQCTDSDNPGLTALRALVQSADFQSVTYGSAASPSGSVVSRIHLDIWLPIIGSILLLLIAVVTYFTIRTKQYKQRIALLNHRESGRATGFSVVTPATLQDKSVGDANTSNMETPLADGSIHQMCMLNSKQPHSDSSESLPA